MCLWILALGTRRPMSSPAVVSGSSTPLARLADGQSCPPGGRICAPTLLCSMPARSISERPMPSGWDRRFPGKRCGHPSDYGRAAWECRRRTGRGTNAAFQHRCISRHTPTTSSASSATSSTPRATSSSSPNGPTSPASRTEAPAPRIRSTGFSSTTRTRAPASSARTGRRFSRRSASHSRRAVTSSTASTSRPTTAAPARSSS